jgi:hypothetical protein
MNLTDRDAPDDLPTFSPDEEAALQAEIERAMEPYAKTAPTSLLPTLRERLEHALRTHPDARQLLRGFATRKPGVVSGDGPVDGSQRSENKAGGNDGA